MLLKTNPLLEKPVISVDDFGLSRAFESGKVSESFWLPDVNLLLIKTDRIGAYDQPHRMMDGRPAFYSGKGIISNAFSLEGEAIASSLMPTDHINLSEDHKKVIPPELWSRSSVHLPVKERVSAEAIVRTGCEGSMAKTAKEGKLLCGQEIEKGLYKGKQLSRPMFTPTSKAPKGEKDKPYTLEEYYQEIGDKDIANYIYGISVLLHLAFRENAADKSMDHPDDKFEFGIFSAGLAVGKSADSPAIYGRSWEDRFSNLCFLNDLQENSWREMPNFDFDLFVEFANENAKTGVVRLIDERASTDSSRYRPLFSTGTGRDLHENGGVELARAFLDDFWCKEWFRAQSKATGKGGYDSDSKQIVTLEDWILTQTGQKNLMTYLALYGR